MILSKEIETTINNRYVKHYIQKGYNIKGGQTIKVKIEDLTLNSNVLIDIKCDKCDTKKQTQYNHYNKYTKNQQEPYYCHKCNNIKRKKTNNKKYGCDNVFQNAEIKEKRKETMIAEYGNEHALNIDEFKEKFKKTNLERFGTEYASQNIDIKQKIEDTFFKNYGVKTSLLNPETIEKIKKTNTKLYGVDNILKLRKYKEEKMLKKYNVEYPIQSTIFSKEINQTCLEKYGYENPMSNEIIKNKMIQTKLEKGIYLSDEQRTEYKNYWLKVKKETNKHKKELFEKWDGTDYYDDENIIDNFLLTSGNKKYPTIDHKTSVSYGFKNNIPPKTIGNIDNLCITKRSINSSKGKNNQF